MRTFKLVVGILCLTLMVVFIGFNLDNKVAITFFSKKATIDNVPVYLVIFSSFIIGVFFTLPFAFFKKVKYLYAVKEVDEKASRKDKYSKKRVAGSKASSKAAGKASKLSAKDKSEAVDKSAVDKTAVKDPLTGREV